VFIWKQCRLSAYFWRTVIHRSVAHCGGQRIRGWQYYEQWSVIQARRICEQESLANAKVSTRQPWYIGRNSLHGPHLGSSSNINVIYTSLKSTFSAQQFRRWQCRSIFIRLAVVASQTCQLPQNSAKIWTYSSSRSSKVDDFGTNRKRIYEFLLVINSNFGSVLHRFWDTATYWLKIAYFSYPSLIRHPRSLCSLWNFAVKLSVRKLESRGYLWWRLHDPNFNRLWLIHPCDGRTDWRAIAYSAL